MRKQDLVKAPIYIYIYIYIYVVKINYLYSFVYIVMNWHIIILQFWFINFVFFIVGHFASFNQELSRPILFSDVLEIFFCQVNCLLNFQLISQHPLFLRVRLILLLYFPVTH